VSASALFVGPYQHEARAAFLRAIESGLSVTRAYVLAQVASFKDGWLFRSTLAEKVGCSVRTVARAFAQAKREGLLRTHRAKKREIPPGCDQPLRCGWSHRFVIGWGAAGAAVKQAVECARARWLMNRCIKPVAATAHTERFRGSSTETRGVAFSRPWSSAELAQRKEKALRDLAELEAKWAREERERKPPD
jgi:AraC-like DNA-binding protein